MSSVLERLFQMYLQPHPGSPAPKVVAIPILLLVVLGAAVWFVVQRARRRLVPARLDDQAQLAQAAGSPQAQAAGSFQARVARSRDSSAQ